MLVRAMTYIVSHLFSRGSISFCVSFFFLSFNCRTIFIIMGFVSLLNELTEFHSKPVKNVLNTGDNSKFSNHIKITDLTSLIPLVH